MFSEICKYISIDGEEHEHCDKCGKLSEWCDCTGGWSEYEDMDIEEIMDARRV